MFCVLVSINKCKYLFTLYVASSQESLGIGQVRNEIYTLPNKIYKAFCRWAKFCFVNPINKYGQATQTYGTHLHHCAIL